MDPITVFIADAHGVLQQRLSKFLAQYEDLRVVGEAADGRQVLSEVALLQPHILLMDVGKLVLGRHELLPHIRAKSPRTKILLLADLVKEDFIVWALQQGVHGCVRRTALPTELVKAIRTTHAGEFWAPRKLVARALETLRWMSELQGSLASMREALTDREQEVVMWAVQGLTNREIAMQLGISAKTVKTHLQNVFRKLNVRRRGQLLRGPHPRRAGSPP